MDEFTPKNAIVSILGKEYVVRELTLAQKNKLLGHVGEFFKSLAGNVFFRKDNNGGIRFDWADEVSLSELNVDKIILSSIDATSELLVLAIPDFKDWDNLPESASREALVKAAEIQDFKGYFLNFILVGTAIIR